jgi:hypothetical protein
LIEGLTPVVVDQFGGLVTSVDRSDLANGLAAEAVDVEFGPGLVQSRGPFVDYLNSTTGTLAASPVQSILSFPTNDGKRHRLILLANGTLQDEYPEGTVTTVETLLGQNLLMRGCILNNRAFMAFSDGKTPAGRPMQWNGAWWDPVGQEGTSSASGIDSTNAASGNATASAINARQVMTLFETRTGYLTLPSSGIPNAAAVTLNDQYIFTAMPTPPTNVVKTRIAMTANLGSDYYSATGLVQAPAAGATYWTPAYSVNRPGFSDTDLANSMMLTHERLTNWPLPPCMGLETYNARIIAWGALNNVPKMLLSFQGTMSTPAPLVLDYTAGLKNGSFTGGADPTSSIPTGWIGGGGSGAAVAGGALVQAAGGAGPSYVFTGDGATSLRGTLTTAYSIERWNDFPPGVDYWVRMRVKRSSTATHGQLVFKITSSTQSPQPTILVSNMTTEWAWYSFRLLPAADTTVNRPYLSIEQETSGGAKLDNNATVSVDEITIYPVTAPNLNGYLLISSPNDPETFDYTHGILGVRPGDGQAVVNCAEMRGVLYAFKERSLFAVNDNGSDPYQWPPPSLMSDAVGCLSIHGVGRGDGWLVTISESGVYLFAGGQPIKMSQEIQPTWARVNLAYKHLSWCVVDADAQRVYIGVPLNSVKGANDATYVNALLMCDYVSGGPQIDPITSPGSGRKWSIWTPPSAPGFTCGARVDRDDGERTFVVGGGVASTSGYISKREPEVWGTTTDTFGASAPNIASVYETATIGLPQQRSFFGFVAAKARGTGTGVLGLSLVRPDGTTLDQADRAVATSPLHDLEWQIAQTDTQIGLRFTAKAATGANAGFVMKRAAAYHKDAVFSKMRGHS